MKRMSKSPQQKANEGAKYLGTGGARNAAKQKMSRQERMQKALRDAQKARRGN